MNTVSKASLRRRAKIVRQGVDAREPKSIELIRQFPLVHFNAATFAGFWPLGDEIDMRPVMTALVEQGERACLPLTGTAGTALSFKKWSPTTPMVKGRYGTYEPQGGEGLSPTFIFVPLLAFDMSGGRLGYGGGYYDRTIEALRRAGHAVFTCGVGFDAQKTEQIPMEPHDVRLDAVLTPSGFHCFKKDRS
ncbi:MAG: 5-formyltetrahydrofolate cyclo-ligase [Maricaulaceae bacterium]